MINPTFLAGENYFPVILAIIALVGWGTADIFGGLVSRKIGGYSSSIWLLIINVVIASLYIPFALPSLGNINLQTILWLLILGPLTVFPMIALYEGIRVGNASLVGTIAGSFGALTVVLSIIFFKETLNYHQVGAIILILTGIILSSINLKEVSLNKILTDKGIPYALAAWLFWGLYFTFVRIPIKEIGWFWPAYFSWLAFPLGIIYMRYKKKELRKPTSSRLWLYLIMDSFLVVIGVLSYNLAITRGQTSIIAPIASSYPALFALLAYFVFKDHLSKQQILGMIITLGGIIILSAA